MFQIKQQKKFAYIKKTYASCTGTKIIERERHERREEKNNQRKQIRRNRNFADESPFSLYIACFVIVRNHTYEIVKTICFRCDFSYSERTHE